MQFRNNVPPVFQSVVSQNKVFLILSIRPIPYSRISSSIAYYNKSIILKFKVLEVVISIKVLSDNIPVQLSLNPITPFYKRLIESIFWFKRGFQVTRDNLLILMVNYD